MHWEVRPELAALESGLDPDVLAVHLSQWFAAHGVNALPQLTVSDAGHASTVGANFTLAADTPGQALDEAVRLLRKAAEESAIPVGPLEEAEIERAEPGEAGTAAPASHQGN
ncbi:hypothetical protein [Streptomyces iconiensis]|uniref:Uncharacterized protein n=1 Tax=Streptomyces iconiensis TaxID=1384038 RepID=A0ABT7AAH6_9ACTN|nr:hypothetical protein [Streptomyces iconiensis]MDJ1138321.1 hypothetical protein [Streptomyces iconiensis]